MKSYNLHSALDKISTRHLELYLGSFMVIISLFLYSQTGIRIMDDSHGYLNWAEELQTHTVSPFERRFWYLSYVLVLFLFTKLGAGVMGVILLQVGLSALATILIFRMTYELDKNKVTGIFAALLYICWIEIAQWNVYILTESLFTSCCVVSVYLAFRLSGKKVIAAIPLFLFTILLRPMGITFAIALSIALNSRLKFTSFFSGYRRTFTSTVLSILLLIVLVLLIEANPNLEFYYAQGEVVYGASLFMLTQQNDWLVIDNSSLVFPQKEGLNVLRFISFIYSNALFFVELFMKKLFFFILHVKPYYSTLHNILILVSLPIAYFMCALGLIRTPKVEPVKVFSIFFFTLNAIMVSLTIEAWDGRFLIPILPFVFIFAAIGAQGYLRKIGYQIANIINPWKS